MRIHALALPAHFGRKWLQPGEQEVRVSLIRIIRDHLRDSSVESWQGYIFRFHRVIFDGGDLSHINVTGGYVSFYDAQFVSGKMDFRGAAFSGGTVDFQEAKFSGANVDFRRTRFAGGQVKFPDSVFAAGEVDFRAAKFSQGPVDLTRAVFAGGVVDLRDPADGSAMPAIPNPPPAQVLL
jgi:uncharacterized protein YjbI with pentapeptide repeats